VAVNPPFSSWLEDRKIIGVEEEHDELHGLRLRLDDGASIALGSDDPATFAWDYIRRESG